MAIQLGDTAGDPRVRPDEAPASAVRANAAARKARFIPRQGKVAPALPVPVGDHQPATERRFHVEVIHRKPSDPYTFSAPVMAPAPAEIAPVRSSKLLPYALGCALLAPPVGAVLAIIALVRTADGRIRGRGEAILALTVAVTTGLFAPLVGVLSYDNYQDRKNTEIVSTDLLAARRAVLAYEREHHRLPLALTETGFVQGQSRTIQYGVTNDGQLCLAGRGPLDHVLLYVGQDGSVSPDGC